MEIKNTLVPSILLLSPFPTPFGGHQAPQRPRKSTENQISWCRAPQEARAPHFHPRHPVHNHPILELRGCNGAWATTIKKDVRAPRSRWFRQFCAIPLRSGGAILVCKMVNCENSPFCRKNRGRRSKIDVFFPNDFDKKVNRSS